MKDDFRSAHGWCMKPNLNVALIGCGFMGRAHANAYKRLNEFFPVRSKINLKAVFDRDPQRAGEFARTWGFEHVAEGWEQLLNMPEVDLIDICTPNDSHHVLAVAAAARDKIVLCEKPLARTVAEAEEMVQAVEAAGVPNMVWFNLRRMPAVAFAKQLMSEGRVGQVFHYRSTYLQDWTISPDIEQGGDLWRLDADVAGSGVIADLLCHCVDAAMWLNGPITSVTATTETFVKERRHQLSGKLSPVRVDDACSVLAKFANGSMGIFESSRFARGRNNYMTLEVNGSNGSLSFNLEDPQWLNFYEYLQPESTTPVNRRMTGWRSIHVTGFDHPYMQQYWVPGACIGFEHTFLNALADFVLALESDRSAEPTFRTALATQKVCEAVHRSARTGRWEDTALT
jgi:predicted dehydrogenase